MRILHVEFSAAVTLAGTLKVKIVYELHVYRFSQFCPVTYCKLFSYYILYSAREEELLFSIQILLPYTYTYLYNIYIMYYTYS